MKHFLYLIIIGLAAYSCTPPLYIPNVSNTPTLKEKGDVDITYSFGTNGHDLIGAYAPTDELGLMINGSYGNSNYQSSTNYVKHQYIEAGAGYLDTENSITLFFGGGFGEASGNENWANILDQYFGLNKISGHYNKLFLQPSINFSDNDKVDLLLTIRASYVTVSELNSDIDFGGFSQNDYEEYQQFIQRKHDNLFIEPTFTLKTGSEDIKYFMQFGVSKAIFPVRETVFRQRPAILTIGLHADLNVIK